MLPSGRSCKVLIINDSLDLGGAEHQLALFAKYLPNEWIKKVWVIDGGPNFETLRANNIPFFLKPRKWQFDISPAFDLWRLIINWRPDIIHAWGWMSCIAAIPLCRMLGIPIINGIIRDGNRPLRWTMFLQRFGLMMSDGIIANSRSGLEAWDITDQRGKVIYNGFDPERLKLSKQFKKDDKFTIVMVGRMVKEKDFISFIDAARRLSKESGSWRFLVIGAGPERSKLIDYAKDLIEIKILDFPEADLEVIPLISTADVGVLMTTPLIHYEGCSNSIMEYMSLKLPVICTLGGGNQEIVIDGQTGFVIPPGNSETLTNRLIYLNENRALAQKMGNAGYKRFLQLFSVERMVDETVKYYYQFIK